MEIKQYVRIKSDIEKQSINYRIQNRGAMCSKLAGVLFFKWIIEHNLQNKVIQQFVEEYKQDHSEAQEVVRIFL